jgi:2-polyprenyl-3-methyl-5-hydroxy-6-metoxy-1,4-benzoquinol methylase
MDRIDNSSSGETASSSNYNANAIIQHFDDFGIHEWERLVQTPSDEVNLYIHAHYLEKYITKGTQVLEIGAGAGRFTQILAGLGAEIMVADISNVQLELNKRQAAEFGFDEAVLGWQQTDICDLSRFKPGSFDCVVAYGGPFSYVLEQRDLALTECLRVLRSGGLLLLSVMSLWGSAHGCLDGVLSLPVSVNQEITNTGDITPATFPERRGNFMHLFRAGELKVWLEQKNLRIMDISASNCISLTWNDMLKEIRNDAEHWEELLRMELEACAEEGCLNMGTHLVAVVRKPEKEM